MQKILERNKKILIYIVLVVSFVFLIGGSSNSEVLSVINSEKKELFEGNSNKDFEVADDYIKTMSRRGSIILKLNISDIDNANIDRNKIKLHFSDGSTETILSYPNKIISHAGVIRDNSCQVDSNIKKCNAILFIDLGINNMTSNIVIEKIEFQEGFVTYNDGNLSKKKEQDVNITIEDKQMVSGFTNYGVHKQPVTITANYDYVSNLPYRLATVEGGKYTKVPDYKLGMPVKKNANYNLEITLRSGMLAEYYFTLDIPEITILDTKQTTDENGEFNLHLYVYDVDKIKDIDPSKINVSNLNNYNVVGNVCNDCKDYNYILTFKNLNINNKQVNIDKVELDEGFIVYKDDTLSSMYTKDSGVEIIVNPYVEINKPDNTIVKPSIDNSTIDNNKDNQEQSNVENPKTGIYSIGFMILTTLGILILLVINNKKLNLFKKF